MAELHPPQLNYNGEPLGGPPAGRGPLMRRASGTGTAVAAPARSPMIAPSLYEMEYHDVSETPTHIVDHSIPIGYQPGVQTIYIAGPMRGYTDFNFPAFDAAAATFRLAGWHVLNPAEHDRAAGFDPSKSIEENNFDVSQAFRWDVESIMRSHAIYMLKQWEFSEGANLEHAVAKAIDIDIIYQVRPSVYAGSMSWD